MPSVITVGPENLTGNYYSIDSAGNVRLGTERGALSPRKDLAEATQVLAREATLRARTRALGGAFARKRASLERSERPKVEAMMGTLGRRVSAEGAERIANHVAVQEATGVSRADRKLVNEIIKASGIPDWSEKVIRPWLAELWKKGWYGAAAITGPDIASSVRDKQVQAALKAGGKRMGLLDLEGDTKEALFRVISLSREKGLGQASPRTVAKWIQQEVPAGRFVNAGPRYRAQLITRTEIMHSTRAASLAQSKADPFVDRVQAIDGDYDEECAARNGEIYTIDEAEVVNGETHPNCTLCFVPAAT